MLAIGLFLAIVVLTLKFTKKEKRRKTHTEVLEKFGPGGSFEENKAKYIKAIKQGVYKSKELACRDLYDIDDEFYKCLEEVYF